MKNGKWVKVTMKVDTDLWISEEDWSKLKDRSFLREKVLNPRSGSVFSFEVNEKGEKV